MNEQEKELFFKEFNNGLHLIGRVTLILATILLLAVPFIIGMVNDVKPDMGAFFSGLLKIGIIYIPMAIVEFLIYTPMLGAGGGYLSFLTGNVTNMKIPCAMNARDLAKTEVGTSANNVNATSKMQIYFLSFI